MFMEYLTSQNWHVHVLEDETPILQVELQSIVWTLFKMIDQLLAFVFYLPAKPMDLELAFGQMSKEWSVLMLKDPEEEGTSSIVGEKRESLFLLQKFLKFIVNHRLLNSLKEWHQYLQENSEYLPFKVLIESRKRALMWS